MLTPVDVQNKAFKGGIGFDKRDVENFMKELASDYEVLYRSNVELKDKVSTLNESLQHYRAIEDSMQKALALSEKTAEETINAANEKGRQLTIEAEKKAESILEDAKNELFATKNDIYRLQQQYEKFKKQYKNVLHMQLKIIDGEKVDNIDLGKDFKADSPYDEPSSIGSSLGGLGGVGGYTGDNFDDRFERTNQESAFANMGSLNMDPFADAKNGGGRFSQKSTKNYNKHSNKKKASESNTASTKPNDNSKEEQPVSAPNDSAVKTGTEQNSERTISPKHADIPAADDKISVSATPKPEKEKDSAATQDFINKGTVIINEDNADVFEPGVNNTSAPAEEQTESQTVSDSSDEAIIGEVEDKVKESSMLESEDNYDEGFNFVHTEESTISSSENIASSFADTATSFDNSSEFTEETYSGEVEDRINESTMLESEDDINEGFNFLVGNEEEEDDIPTIFPNTPTEQTESPGVWEGVVEENYDPSSLIDNTDAEEDGFKFF